MNEKIKKKNKEISFKDFLEILFLVYCIGSNALLYNIYS